MKNLKGIAIASAILFGVTHSSHSQNDKKSYEFGKGLRMMAKDSSYFVKASFRVQNRYDYIQYKDVAPGDPQHESRFFIARGRLKFDGFVLSPKTTYKVEFDIVGGYVRDAWVRHNFYKNLSIQYGLGKLPGNRERVVSSQKLQFVNRSQFNDAFNIDRDMGFQLLHHFKLGEMVFRETVAYTDGRGINDFSAHEGASYTGRVDFLPFGEFTKKGDFYYADFARERTPKLMLGAVYNFNDKAIDSRGQNGIRLSDTRNLESVFLDMMMKYRGFNLSAEWANKTSTNDSPVVKTDSLTGEVLESFYTGQGYVVQLGYLFKSNWELAGRYTVVNPDERTERNDIVEYTIGLSKYIVEHSLKIQSDISYQDNNTIFNDLGERTIFRLQMELSF